MDSNHTSDNIVFVCSPLRGDYDYNIKKAAKFCRWLALHRGVIPFAPHLYFTRFLDDTVVKERNIGISIGLDVMLCCCKVMVLTENDVISEGMRREIAFAEKMQKPIEYIRYEDIRPLLDDE
jgi:hypothetical protein